MKQFIDLIPGLIFFAVYFITKDFMLATYALIISSALQLIFNWFVKKQLDKMQLAIFLMLLPMAALTLIFHNALFLKWKPSIVNWVFAAILWISYYFKGKNLTRTLLQSMTANTPDFQLNLPEKIWIRVNHSIAWFFMLEGILNLIVAYSFSTSIWVTYKVMGVLLLNFGGIILLFWYLLRASKRNTPIND